MELNGTPRKLISVMIVDDQLLIRDAIAAMLESSGRFKVTDLLERGDDAHDAARRSTPQIAIIDIEMPGRSAFDTARAIRASSPETRVVFLTGHGHRRFMQEAADIGAAAFLEKTTSPADVLYTLERVGKGEQIGIQQESDPDAGRFDRLSPRELEVLKYIAQGLSTREMAEVMFLSPRTVERHVERLMSRLGIRDRLRLALYAFAEGIATAPRVVHVPVGHESAQC
ncbi:MAG: response regulator transcription factor [Phycisphaeraceae bacterium]|nr:response regulator transcription factor [Phycisphaeraceae bacterium]